jgi:hypothetical protein
MNAVVGRTCIAMFVACTTGCAVEPADDLPEYRNDVSFDADGNSLQHGCGVQQSCSGFAVNHTGAVSDSGVLVCAVERLASAGPVALGLFADDANAWAWDWEIYGEVGGQVQVLRTGEMRDWDNELYAASVVESCVLKPKAFFEACLAEIAHDPNAACGRPTRWFDGCVEVATLSCDLPGTTSGR